MSTEPLPLPHELWARASTLAVVHRAAGIADAWPVDEDGVRYDDGGGNDALLVPLPAGRLVVAGFDHEYSETVDADPPIDLLAGGPAWLPWDLLVPRQERDELGLCHWWDGERWFDGRPAGRDEPDGAAMVLRDLASDEATIRAARSVLGAGRDEPDDGLRALLGAAAGGVVAPEHVDALPGTADDAEGALAVARACGITPGAPRPSRAPRPSPAQRRVRRRSSRAHAALLHAAMREAAERPRPATPIPGRLGRLLGRGGRPAAEQALLDHVRGRLPAGAERGVLLVLCSDGWSTSAEDPAHPLERAGGGDRVVRALRDADRDAAHGSWWFVRVSVGPDGDRIDRAFDGIPAWWPADHPQQGPGPEELRVELERRDAAWRPAWAPLLDEAHETVPIEAA